MRTDTRPLRRYLDVVGGDLSTAWMLNQIVYWYQTDRDQRPKLRAQRHGVYWLAKSHVDWTAELGLTRRQSQRCLNRLRAFGLVETKLMKFAGITKLHVRLVCAEGAASLPGYPDFPVQATWPLPAVVPQPLHQSVQQPMYPTVPPVIIPVPPEVQSAAHPEVLQPLHLQVPSYTETTTEKTTYKDFAANAAEAAQNAPPTPDQGEGGESGLFPDWASPQGASVFECGQVRHPQDCPQPRAVGSGLVHTGWTSIEWRPNSRPSLWLVASKGEIAMNAMQVVAAKAAEQTQTRPASAPTGIRALGLLWMKRMAAMYDDYQKPLAGREYGQLKHLVKLVGIGRATSALDYALDHWSEFCWTARQQQGLAAVPQRPVIGFMVCHHDVLLQLIAKSCQTRSMLQSPVTVVPETQQQPQPADNVPMTPAEKAAAKQQAIRLIAQMTVAKATHSYANLVK